MTKEGTECTKNTGRERQRKPDTLTVQQVADALGVSRRHIYKLIKARRLPKLKTIGPIRVSKAALRRVTGWEEVTE